MPTKEELETMARLCSRNGEFGWSDLVMQDRLKVMSLTIAAKQVEALSDLAACVNYDTFPGPAVNTRRSTER